MAFSLKQRTEPDWIDLGSEVELLCRPATTAVVFLARGRADALIAKVNEGADVLGDILGRDIEGIPDLEDEAQEQSLRKTMFVFELAKLAILDWRNVNDANGKPLAFKPELLRWLLDYPLLAEMFLQKYLSPVDEVDREGNVSRPLPNGTSGRAGAPSTAKAAKLQRRPARRRGGKTARTT